MSWLKKRLRRLVGLKAKPAKAVPSPPPPPPIEAVVAADQSAPLPEQPASADVAALSPPAVRQSSAVSAAQLQLRIIDELNDDDDLEQTDAMSIDSLTSAASRSPSADRGAVAPSPPPTPPTPTTPPASQLPVKIGGSFRRCANGINAVDNNNATTAVQMQRDAHANRPPVAKVPLSDRCWAIAPGPEQVVATRRPPGLHGKLPRLDRVQPQTARNEQSSVCFVVCDLLWCQWIETSCEVR